MDFNLFGYNSNFSNSNGEWYVYHIDNLEFSIDDDSHCIQKYSMFLKVTYMILKELNNEKVNFV